MSKAIEQPPPAIGPIVDEAEFAAVFRREIAEQLAGLKAQRQRRVWFMWLAGGGLLVLCWTIAGLALSLGNTSNPDTIDLAVTSVIVGPMFAIAVYQSANKSFAGDILTAVMPPLCRLVGNLSYERKPFSPPDPKRFRDLLVVDRFSVSAVEDGFEGCHRNTRFRMAEATLSRIRGRRAVPVFRGLLVAIRVPDAFSGRVVLAKERGVVGNSLAEVFTRRGGLDAVAFNDPPFEELFEVYADLPSEALRLLNTDLRRTLVELAGHSAGEGARGRFRAAFDGGEFLLALPRRSELFDVGKLGKPLEELESEAGRLLTEMTIPHRLIDYLHGDRSALP